MATTTANVVCDNSTLAHFQSWANALYSAFTTLGWTQTSDTGQAASSPAAVPSSAYVYWIFKAADSQASTTPIYVKVEVGYSSTAPSIRFTVGSGSDGAGNITGSIMGPWLGAGANTGMANQGAGTFNCYFSGDAGSFRMLMWQNLTPATNAGEIIFGIERSRDTSGNKTTDYVTIVGLFAANSNNAYQNFIQQTMMSGAVTTREWNLFSPQSTSGGSSNTGGTEAFAGNVAANPVFPLVGYLGNPMLAFCTALASDVAESNGTVITVSIYGANHSYLATKQENIANLFAPITGFSTSTNQRAVLMLYE